MQMVSLTYNYISTFKLHSPPLSRAFCSDKITASVKVSTH